MAPNGFPDAQSLNHDQFPILATAALTPCTLLCSLWHTIHTIHTQIHPLALSLVTPLVWYGHGERERYLIFLRGYGYTKPPRQPAAYESVHKGFSWRESYLQYPLQVWSLGFTARLCV